MVEHRKALPGNRIIDRLPAAERQLLAVETEAVEFRAGDVLCGAGARVRHVYFPRQGVISLSVKVDARPAVGVGLIRADGMFGLGVAAGYRKSGVLAVSHGTGRGDRVETSAFRQVLRACPALKDSLFAYGFKVAGQMSRNTACAALHPSRQRIARWLLDVTEGAPSPAFSSTQAAIADTLGLQRPAVSRVAADLQRYGLIRYLRGEVTILDRTALRAIACGCSRRSRPAA